MPIDAIGSGSKRYNQGKVKMSYIPPKTQFDLLHFVETGTYELPVRGLIRLAEHFSLGVAKYPDEIVNGVAFPNWAKGQNFDSMLINCVLRHYYAWAAGEEVDEDFGSHHLIAVAWGLCCLHHQFSNYDLYKQFDDRMWTGFSFSDVPDYDNESRLLIMDSLQKIQTSTDAKQCATLCITALFDVLSLYESEQNDLKLNFKIDVERLNKIKNKDYGTPTTAS